MFLLVWKTLSPLKFWMITLLSRVLLVAGLLLWGHWKVHGQGKLYWQGKERVQKWLLSELVKQKKKVQKRCLPAFKSLKSIPTEPCPSGRCFNISQPVCFTHDLGVFQFVAFALGLGTSDSGLCVSPLTENLRFLQPFGSPRHKHHWFSKPGILGVHLPRAGTKVEVPDMRLEPLTP